MASENPDDPVVQAASPAAPDGPSRAGRPPTAHRAALPTASDLPVAVFRPSPNDRVVVAGPCHARALCLSACPSPEGVAAVFVDPCGSLLAIATAPKAVVGAMLVDPAPFARLTELLGASRVYLEAPAGDASAVGDAVAAALWPMCVKTEVLHRASV
ncbi:hypothetical protein [Candidatus Poriferisodalis sp.]|uniref:hypothetical protein n=1 Tax=Candidatus Poriferisodalis sp. TaxID=3101277 RepID=UPI003B01E425